MTEGIKQENQEIIRKLWENETSKYVGILEEDTSKKVVTKEKIKKEYIKKTRKLQNQTLREKSHQRDKQLGFPCYKILSHILEVD